MANETVTGGITKIGIENFKIELNSKNLEDESFFEFYNERDSTGIETIIIKLTNIVNSDNSQEIATLNTYLEFTVISKKPLPEPSQNPQLKSLVVSLAINTYHHSRVFLLKSLEDNHAFQNKKLLPYSDDQKMFVFLGKIIQSWGNPDNRANPNLN